ncbi:MAG TPA: hypothetical protein VGM24_00990 [Puia sp.]
MNIIETIQKNLGFEPIQKIDPNSQEVANKEAIHGNTALAQAAIPSILLGLFNRLEKERDASWLAGDQPTGRLLEKIFGQSNDKVIEIVSVYCLTTDQNVKQEMEHIASESVRVVRDHVADLTSEDSIAAFVSQHKHEVLLYLPASLQLGSILGNDNLDDRTNKMEGPVSGLMHRIEKQFNSSGNN